MRTPASDTHNGTPGVGEAAKQVADHAKALVGLELELAKVELTQKFGSLGLGVGLVVGAAVLGLYALGFLFATIAAALATFLPTWLALLIVTLLLVAVAAVLGLVGRSRIRAGAPPVPEQAIEEAKLTTEAIKRDGD
jgi:Putative Actinobacterial Holin-X, holin superfamily III